jgi:hypothetical protein
MKVCDNTAEMEMEGLFDICGGREVGKKNIVGGK